MRKIVPILAAVIGIAGAAPARAQSAALFPPYEAVTIVRSMGLHPLGPPLRRGPTYVVRALDRYGEEMRVAVDVRSGEILSAVPVISGGLQRPYRPYPARSYPHYGSAAPDDLDDVESELEMPVFPEPPRVIEAPRDVRPRSVATVPTRTPARAPMPRPRPSAAAVSQSAPANALPAGPEAKPTAPVSPEVKPAEPVKPPTPDVPVAPLY